MNSVFKKMFLALGLGAATATPCAAEIFAKTVLQNSKTGQVVHLLHLIHAPHDDDQFAELTQALQELNEPTTVLIEAGVDRFIRGEQVLAEVIQKLKLFNFSQHTLAHGILIQRLLTGITNPYINVIPIDVRTPICSAVSEAALIGTPSAEESYHQIHASYNEFIRYYQEFREKILPLLPQATHDEFLEYLSSTKREFDVVLTITKVCSWIPFQRKAVLAGGLNGFMEKTDYLYSLFDVPALVHILRPYAPQNIVVIAGTTHCHALEYFLQLAEYTIIDATCSTKKVLNQYRLSRDPKNSDIHSRDKFTLPLLTKADFELINPRNLNAALLHKIAGLKEKLSREQNDKREQQETADEEATLYMQQNMREYMAQRTEEIEL